MKSFIVGSLILGASLAWAENTIDVYGDPLGIVAPKLDKYFKDIQAITDLKTKYQLQVPTEEELMRLEERKAHLRQKIADELKLLYVDFSVISYGPKGTYTTVEVITPNQSRRLKFVDSEPIKYSCNKEKEVDLVDHMIAYHDKGARYFLQHGGKVGDCPFYHCLWGFKDELSFYLPLFQQTEKQKQFVLDTLKNDKCENRREAAVFLVGHFNDPKEIISILTPYVGDPNAGVRNNALRVLQDTIGKANIKEFNIEPMAALLESVYDTDRNKSLLVIWRLSKSPLMRSAIISQAGQSLVSLLQLKQPNNHDLAYLILKNISGHDYPEHDIKAWKNWVDKAQKG